MTTDAAPRMAGIGKCPTCGLSIRWGMGCIGPELVTASLDVAKAHQMVIMGELGDDEPMPQRRRRLQRAEWPRGDLLDLGEYCGDCGAGYGQYHTRAATLRGAPAAVASPTSGASARETLREV